MSLLRPVRLWRCSLRSISFLSEEPISRSEEGFASIAIKSIHRTPLFRDYRLLYLSLMLRLTYRRFRFHAPIAISTDRYYFKRTYSAFISSKRIVTPFFFPDPTESSLNVNNFSRVVRFVNFWIMEFPLDFLPPTYSRAISHPLFAIHLRISGVSGPRFRLNSTRFLNRSAVAEWLIGPKHSRPLARLDFLPAVPGLFRLALNSLN